MDDVVLKRFEQPDEDRDFAKGRLEIVRIGELTIGRAIYEPGWKWSEHVGQGKRWYTSKAGAKGGVKASERMHGVRLAPYRCPNWHLGISARRRTLSPTLPSTGLA